MSTNSIPPNNRPSSTDCNAIELTPTRDITARMSDRALIPGIYQTCDQWCMYCQATNRCLAFRSTNGSEVNGIWDPVDASEECLAHGMQLVTSLAETEGVALPPEIEAILSGDRRRQRAVFTLDDPLERLGRSYMKLAEAYLTSRTDFPPALTWRQEGPTPLEVLTWYHVLAPSRIFRAILCAEEAARGVDGRYDDALCAAKVALVGIDRSLTALSAIETDDDDPRVELLQRQLQRLGDAVDARFPEAGGFVRPGLDEDAAGSRRPVAAGWPGWLRAIRRRLAESAYFRGR
jgi:hypothetical protein